MTSRGIMRRLSILLLTAPIVSGAAQATGHEEKQPFSIIITPSDAEAQAGSVVYVKVKVVNTSQRDIRGRGTFYAAGLDTSFQYDCRNSQGKLVNKDPMDFGSAPGSVHDSPPLHPGASYEDEEPVSLACDLSKPGEYKIQVSRKILNDPEHGVVRSNVIKIAVKP